MRWRTPSTQICVPSCTRPFAVHARADAGLVEQIDRDLLDHAGADAAEHVVAGVPLEDDVVDAGLVQQLAEQQAGRTGADDGDLRPHGPAFLADSIPARSVVGNAAGIQGWFV